MRMIKRKYHWWVCKVNLSSPDEQRAMSGIKISVQVNSQSAFADNHLNYPRSSCLLHAGGPGARHGGKQPYFASQTISQHKTPPTHKKIFFFQGQLLMSHASPASVRHMTRAGAAQPAGLTEQQLPTNKRPAAHSWRTTCPPPLGFKTRRIADPVHILGLSFILIFLFNHRWACRPLSLSFSLSLPSFHLSPSPMNSIALAAAADATHLSRRWRSCPDLHR